MEPEQPASEPQPQQEATPGVGGIFGWVLLSLAALLLIGCILEILRRN